MEIMDLIAQLKELYSALENYPASDIIKFVLKKQIPEESEWDIDGWRCPSCGCKRKERFSHCVACGQALKRTETNIEPPKED